MKFKTIITQNTTLFEALSGLAPISPQSVKRLIKSREAKVNGTRVADNIELKCGDEVEAFIPKSFICEAPRIVYEDDNVLVVCKPVHTEVVPTLRELMSEGRDFVEPIHRLDRNTTGIVVFARNKIAYDILYESFRARTAEKHYVALTCGKAPEVGEYTAYLFKDSAASLCYVSDKPKSGYKKIITKIEATEKYGDAWLIYIELVTGRTHQIRAHMSFLGYPIIGDEKYGDHEANKKFGFKYQKLCAYKLIFHSLPSPLSYLNEKVFEVKANFID